MNLEKTFTDFLKQEELVGKKLLLAISGGVDSTVLLEVASLTVDIKDLAVFHLDHGARKNSKKDLEFVQKMCSKKGIKFYGESLTKTPAKNKEEFWRDQRKKLSNKIAKDFKAERILTAHHATDLVETMLFRLVKGCGVAGLSPFDRPTKPFWQVPRTEIEKYAKEKKLKFVKDSSNDDINLERNLIRHKVLPKLRIITPNLEKVFVSESRIFSEVSDFLAKSITAYTKSPLPLKDFLELSPILRTELLRLISTKTPSSSEIRDLLKWLKNNPKGNSVKSIGGTKIQLKTKKLYWE